MSWDPPSLRVRELIALGARRALDAPPEWLDGIDEATFGSTEMSHIVVDPELRADSMTSNRANLLHWAAANLHNPGAPVTPNVDAPAAVARNIVRRGYDHGALDAYRRGQNEAWRLWMEIAFELTDDPVLLHELFTVTAQSISAFIDATVDAVDRQIRIERENLIQGVDSDRREMIALVLDGSPVSVRRAESVLRYELDQTHTAAVIWSLDPAATSPALDDMVEWIGRHTLARQQVRMAASSRTIWCWFGSPSREIVKHDILEYARTRPGVDVAVGSAESGIEGFRRSHLDAINTQRMLASLDRRHRFAAYAEVQAVLAMTHDPESADRFVRRSLGPLADASAELKQTVLVYVDEQCNASRAAKRLFTHRNTVLRRLEHAEQLLPGSLRHNSVHIAMALEVLHWQRHSSV